MNENSTNPKAEKKLEAAMFDHERLDVYRIELKFIAWVTPLLEEVSRSATGKTSEVRDQLDRASLSTLLNTAEGNGKRQRQVRAKFFDDARGSATECAACLDALVVKQAATEERVAEGKKLLLRACLKNCRSRRKEAHSASKMQRSPWRNSSLVTSAPTKTGIFRHALRIVSMLCGLIERFDGPAAFHEDSAEDQSEKPVTGQKVNYYCKVSRTRTRKRTSRI